MKNLFLISAVAVAALLCGCMSMEYVGQEFAATPEDRPVLWFKERSELPRGEYAIIGKAVLTARNGTDFYDIQDELLAKARACGADAVCMIDSRKVVGGTYDIPDDTFSDPNMPIDPANVTPGGDAVIENSFGDTRKLQPRKNVYYNVVVKAVFLKNREELKQLLVERRNQLELLSSDEPPAVQLYTAEGQALPESGQILSEDADAAAAESPEAPSAE